MGKTVRKLYIDPTIVVQTENLLIDHKKVQRHEIELHSMELQLEHVTYFTNIYEVVSLKLPNYDEPCILKQWELPRPPSRSYPSRNEDETEEETRTYEEEHDKTVRDHKERIAKIDAEAKAFYNDILNKLKNGEYLLHVHDNGKIEVELPKLA